MKKVKKKKIINKNLLINKSLLFSYIIIYNKLFILIKNIFINIKVNKFLFINKKFIKRVKKYFTFLKYINYFN